MIVLFGNMWIMFQILIMVDITYSITVIIFLRDGGRIAISLSVIELHWYSEEDELTII